MESRRRPLLRIAPTVALAWVAGADAASAFALFPTRDGVLNREVLERASRWSAEPDPFGFGTGLHDGIQVAVDPDFAGDLGVVTAEELALLEGAVTGAFGAWENGVLSFDVILDGPAEEGTSPGQGFEIDVFAVPEAHPVFQFNDFFGVAYVEDRLADDRLLTNGERVDGWVTIGADIYINIDMVLALGSVLTPERQAMALQRLLMHEIGHTIGLGHPNDENLDNWDLDTDPRNPMPIDPLNPFAEIRYSPNRDTAAIMSNGPDPLGALFFNELQPDDRGGRDLLYPVPEPASAALLGAVLAALAGARRPTLA